MGPWRSHLGLIYVSSGMLFQSSWWDGQNLPQRYAFKIFLLYIYSTWHNGMGFQLDHGPGSLCRTPAQEGVRPLWSGWWPTKDFHTQWVDRQRDCPSHQNHWQAANAHREQHGQTHDKHTSSVSPELLHHFLATTMRRSSVCQIFWGLDRQNLPWSLGQNVCGRQFWAPSAHNFPRYESFDVGWSCLINLEMADLGAFMERNSS